jgi:hypothetical protein
VKATAIAALSVMNVRSTARWGALLVMASVELLAVVILLHAANGTDRRVIPKRDALGSS